MKATFALTAIGLMLASVVGCTGTPFSRHTPDDANVHSPDPDPKKLSLCGLYGTAAENNLWNKAVLVRGLFATDFHEYQSVREQCPDGSYGFITLIYGENETDYPEPMRTEILRYCSGKRLCAIEAEIEVVGVLVRTGNRDLGASLAITNVRSFNVMQ